MHNGYELNFARRLSTVLLLSVRATCSKAKVWDTTSTLAGKRKTALL